VGREIRKVPKKWKHPKEVDKYNGKEGYRPMVDYDFNKSYKEWEKELEDWFKEYDAFENKGKEFKYKERVYSKKNGDTYEDWAHEPPSPPNPYDFIPEGKWFQLFENVSEGTPLSPPFATKKELVEWLTNNNDYWGNSWTKEEAEAMVKQEYAPSMIVKGGKVYNSQKSLLIK